MSSIDLIVFIPSSFLPSTTDYIRSYKLHFHPYNHVNVYPNILVCTFYCTFQSLNISTFFQKKENLRLLLIIVLGKHIFKKGFCFFSLCYKPDSSCSFAKSCPTLQSHGLQHTRLSCSSLSPRGFSNSCPLNQ